MLDQAAKPHSFCIARGAADPPLPQTRAQLICAMPELAEVEWYRKQWNAGRGDAIVDLALHARKRVFRGMNTRQMRRLIGERFLNSEARGKRMLFRFSGENWLGIHLGMTGTLRVEAEDHRAEKHDHLVLYQAKRALVFRDSRQFGRVRFLHGTDAPDWWKDEIPEIASPQFNRLWIDNFLDRHRKAPIKAVLLMQHGFSGIGNWMADEILWRAKILPTRRTRSLGEKERAALLRETKVVCRRSLETLGKNYADPPRGWLIHERWSRNGVCPKHRIPLRHDTVGGRTTAWCARCQH
jgi:formamidopyrimidine-DNA glycosylase